jgi:hypothetical protein
VLLYKTMIRAARADAADTTLWHRVAEDETGVLWRAVGDAWAAVEVVNGTPQPDGLREHHFLQVPANLPTPRAGVAWSYGLEEHEYRRLVFRT